MRGSVTLWQMPRPCSWCAPVSVVAITAFAPTSGGQTFLPLYSELSQNGTSGMAVSSDGTYVTGRGSVPSGATHAFLWTHGSPLDLGNIYGGAEGTGVTDNGSVVVGYSGWAPPQPISQRAFRWSIAAGMEDLGTVAGKPSAEAWGVSDDGSVVVGRGFTNYSDAVAFRWTRETGMTSLSRPPGAAYSSASAVSRDGAVVVGYCESGSEDHAVRWTSSGEMQDLGGLPGALSSRASATNGDGSVVVGSSDRRAFRWTLDGGVEDLGTLAGQTTAAQAVNADGSVIAGFGFATGQGFLASIWTANTGWQDLNTLLPGLGVDLAGWRLREVTAISADGLTVVGNGTYLGQQLGWVASIPAPGGVVTGLGLAILAATRRRRSG